MAYHHLAMAARDMAAIHDFYEGVMRFELVKVEVAAVPEGGWAKHFFYRMGGDNSSFIAFWEMHDVPGCENMETALSKAAGVPDQINHIAFNAVDVGDLDERKAQWLAAGLAVLEIDHHWCRSIYTRDPNGNTVEFCVTTGRFNEDDRARALQALTSDKIPFSPDPADIQLHRPESE